MGFSTLGKPTKANVINDNSVKALHRTAESLAETDQWVEEIEAALAQVQEKLAKAEEAVAQGHQQLAQEISLVHPRLDGQARDLSAIEHGIGLAFDNVKSGHEDVTRYVLDLEKKIYQAQDNVQELSKFLDRVEARVEAIPPPPAPYSASRTWVAIGILASVIVGDLLLRYT